MKSLMINDEELHKQVKLLSVQIGKNMTELIEEALRELIEKYRNEHTREN